MLQKNLASWGKSYTNTAFSITGIGVNLLNKQYLGKKMVKCRTNEGGLYLVFYLCEPISC